MARKQETKDQRNALIGVGMNPVHPSGEGSPFVVYGARCTPRLFAELHRRLEGLTMRLMVNPTLDPMLIWDLKEEDDVPAA